MSKEAFRQIVQPEQRIGAVEATMEGVKEFAKAFSLDKMPHDIWQELKQQGAHGAHELASALFRGVGADGYIMYPRQQGNEQEQTADHGLSIEAMKQPEMERGGREM